MAKNITDLKKEAKSFAYKYLDKIAIYNSSFHNFIEINKVGIDHTLNGKPLTEVHILSMYELKEILYSCKYKSSEPPKRGQENVIQIHRFEIVKIIKGVKYKVFIVVREVSVNANEKNKHFFYDHTVIQKV